MARDVLFRDDVRSAVLGAALSGTALVRVLDKYGGELDAPLDLIVQVYQDAYYEALRTIAINLGVDLEIDGQIVDKLAKV